MPDDSANMTAQAKRCRRLARQCDDQQTSDGLNQLADEYDRRASAPKAEGAPPGGERSQSSE